MEFMMCEIYTKICLRKNSKDTYVQTLFKKENGEVFK